MKNVAIIGFGFMGITHALNIQKNKDLNLAAIITRNPDQTGQKLQSQIGNFSSGNVDLDFIRGVNKYSSLKDCLRNEKLDAVHICVHTDLHYPIAREAMENGLHVLLEKPMTLDIQEGKALIKLAQEKNVILMVGHVLRFMPPYEQLKNWINTKEFGALQFLSLTRFSGLPSWGQWKEKQQAFGSSGGALFDLVVHDIDFLNYVLGVPQKILSHTYPGYLSQHDYMSALWNYANRNITARIEGGNIFHSGFPFQAGYMARFEKASILYTTLQPDFIGFSDHDKSWKIPAGDANEGFYNEIAYFYTCIENNTQPLKCSPQSSLQTIELCYRHLL